MDRLAQIFKVLADTNRLRIIHLLGRRKMCVCELADILGIAQPSVSRHLKKLKAACLVKEEQDSFWTNYILCCDDAGCCGQVLNLVRRELQHNARMKQDLRRATRVDRKKLCCRPAEGRGRTRRKQ